MVIDFSKITVYELIALILSFIAIMIPIVQWAWNKWIVKPILKLLPTGKINPYFNRSGSYLGIESVYEAINKPITVKHIALKIVRCRDEKKLNQVWSSFWSPITQRFSGNYSSTIEGAHPFRIEKNSITTAFTEAEQSRIPTVTVKNSDNPVYETKSGNDTEDKIFLLSIDEVEQYFGITEERQCVPTDYAIAQGVYTSGKYFAGGRASGKSGRITGCVFGQ